LYDAVVQRAIDASGTNRRTIDADRPGDVERVAAAKMQLIESHPRRTELLDCAAEQGRRHLADRRGKRGKAKRG
jgi:hypothetical protein